MKKTCVMIQGTTSDAGKTVLVAGLCRVLARRNKKVAPFKPQNMALNSAVTADGGEIGRAQALQAFACGIAPTVHMNPILLKPSSDSGAQVIVQGKAISQMKAQAFHDYKKVAMDAVLTSFSLLEDAYEFVVVEGAGSPAEINLRHNDIANMGFAEATDCPVIIIADIDRGGVFAHLVGTLELLEKSEQDRVVGFVINRFRGDIKLLEPGLDWLMEKTGKPVLGVIPYLHDLFLDAEDAINCHQNLSQFSDKLHVVVPVLPRISNHTDFDVLRMHPDVNLQFCSIKNIPEKADLIILPGSKNVRADLKALKDNGWNTYLNRHLRYGGKLLGICGGYQMLGREITDDLGVEDSAGSESGFGFLDCVTQLAPEKLLSQTRGNLLFDQFNVEIAGYEIHCGETSSNEEPFVKLQSGKIDGAVSTDKQIIGTYLHGLFDVPNSQRALLNWAGLKSKSSIDIEVVRNTQLDRVADAIEENMDLSTIFGET